MSVDIGYHEFTCDVCGKKAFAKGHPEGWKWLKPERGMNIMKTEHACEVCIENVPKSRHGTWGQND